jgi:quercetin dioxygenase-like cupin family protein
MEINYPYTIDNGHGEQLTFLGRIYKDGTEYLAVENCVAPKSGPPMHVHFRQNERITIKEGKIAAQIAGEKIKYYGPGDTVHFEKGIVHRFWNAGDDPLRCSGEIWPPDNIEYFLGEIYRSMREGSSNRPQIFDAAFLLNRYSSEFDMHEIPNFVKKVIFPITLFIGKLKGKHKKFAGAPAPK